MSLVSCLSWTERLLGFALLLQTLELLQLRRAFSDAGVFRWSILAAEHRALPAPLRWMFAVLLPYRPFLLLLVLRLPLIALLMLGVHVAALPLLLSQLAIGARFRGTFNGGSDYMTVVLLLAVAVGSLRPQSATLLTACLAYVCVQLTFSYFIAGIVKLVKPEWRSGAALAGLLGSNRYGTPRWLARLAARPALARGGAWAVLGFECTFPFALLDARLAVGLLGLGALFHVGNVLAFGLNRFLFAWLAAYPALLYFSVQLSHS